MKHSISTIALTMALGTVATLAENWPQFRGPGGQGIVTEKNLPLKWSADENVVWINRDYKFYGEHGLGSSPILYRGIVIMARDGSSDGEEKKLGWQIPWDQSRVIALDAKTVKERWQGKRGLSRISHGVPVIWEHDGKAEVVSEAGDVVQGFDVLTGERLWSNEVIGEGKVPSTVIGDGLVFTCGGWSGQGDQKETRLVWEQKKGMPKVPSMLYVKPHLFAITDGGVAGKFGGAIECKQDALVEVPHADTNPLIIGGNTNPQGRKWVDCFHGAIDDVRLFNRALTEKEVSELSNSDSK